MYHSPATAQAATTAIGTAQEHAIMARKSSTTSPQLNYGVYAVDRHGVATRQVFDGQQPARYETVEQAQAALPRLQAIEDAVMKVWGFTADKLIVGGRTW